MPDLDPDHSPVVTKLDALSRFVYFCPKWCDNIWWHSRFSFVDRKPQGVLYHIIIILETRGWTRKEMWIVGVVLQQSLRYKRL